MASMLTPNPGWRRRRRPVPPVVLAFVASIGLHLFAAAALVLLAWLGWLSAPPAQKADDVQVALRPINASDWAKNRGESPPSKAPQRQQKQQKQRKPETRPDGQVVDVAPGNRQEDPNAKHLAESANKVQKESKSKEQTPNYRNAMPKRTTTAQPGNGHDTVEKPQQAGNDGLGNDDRPLQDPSKKKLALEVPDIQKRDEVKLETSPGEGPGPQIADRNESGEVKGNSNRLRIQDGAPGAGEEGSQGKAGRPGALTLTPSMAALDKITGAPAPDHLDGVEEGDGTYLNTKEWKYAGFFNRVKQSIGMNWNPGRELQQRDPTGAVYGGRDRYTVLEVRLSANGEVKDVQVVKSSGLDFLDLEAMQSFRRAQPFPNPPSGMLEADATVRFQFGFFLEMGGASRMRLFRSN